MFVYECMFLIIITCCCWFPGWCGTGCVWLCEIVWDWLVWIGSCWFVLGIPRCGVWCGCICTWDGICDCIWCVLWLFRTAVRWCCNEKLNLLEYLFSYRLNSSSKFHVIYLVKNSLYILIFFSKFLYLIIGVDRGGGRGGDGVFGV